jgi:hypothetical protein
MEKVVIQQLQGIDLYDLPLLSLQADVMKNLYTFTFEEYDELESKSAPLTLTFSNVSLFKIENPYSESGLQIVACREILCKQKSISEYEIQFILEQEHNTVGTVLTIAFTSLEIHRTLSPLAIEYKNTNFESRMDEREWLDRHHLPLV